MNKLTVILCCIALPGCGALYSMDTHRTSSNIFYALKYRQIIGKHLQVNTASMNVLYKAIKRDDAKRRKTEQKKMALAAPEQLPEDDNFVL